MVESHFVIYAKAAPNQRKMHQISTNFLKKTGKTISFRVETCYHILTDTENLLDIHWDKFQLLLSHSPFENTVWKESQISKGSRGKIIEIGPRSTVKTAICTNILSVFESAGIHGVDRIEQSSIYYIENFDEQFVAQFFESAADKMTECIYTSDISFKENTNAQRDSFFEIDVLSENGRENLEEANRKLGLALDKSDVEFYLDYFTKKLRRNPTDVELFDLAQSDSEHSRHWFFRGKISIDGKPIEKSLMSQIRGTLENSNKNSLIAFSDNSSAIRGFDDVTHFRPRDSSSCSAYSATRDASHLIYSAETHNFPTAVCPFQGATTGVGGRIRDIHATGRGAYEIAGTVGYAFGNLLIPGYDLPWEERSEDYPPNISHPLNIAIEASNGASDYGNKFGEPQISGFARSFGQRIGGDKRWEYLKPIMFSGGIGSIDTRHLHKLAAEPGQRVVKIGGPVYAIGVGGGAASSVDVQGARDHSTSLDFAAVQRGDAEMGGKLRRVVRACAENPENPLLAIHDQGAGGNGNVIKELVEGLGVRVEARRFKLGEQSITLRQLWTAEYQENDAALVATRGIPRLRGIAGREKCDVAVVGDVIAEPRVTLLGFASPLLAVDLDTAQLGERPSKHFNLKRTLTEGIVLRLPADLTVRDALDRVLRLPAVASKRYLTCKVDRSVTGLVARQQCCGPLHTPLADVACVALSYFDKVGGAVALGEQPVKMLVNVEKGVRMCVAETLTNLVWAPISDLKDVKMSGNWMWAAKCEGEGAQLVLAVEALCGALAQTGCAIDGGKDSLSMAVGAGNEIVKSPGTLVLSAYAPCTDITKVVTPNLKTKGQLIFVKCGSSEFRLGGSALAQVYGQIGDNCPDIENFGEINKLFGIIQKMINSRHVIMAGHDISDGGLITCLLEMAFAGNCSIVANLFGKPDPITYFFSEECGVVVEVAKCHVAHVLQDLSEAGLSAWHIGHSEPEFGPDATVKVTYNNEIILNESVVGLREIWEETGDRLNQYQTEENCIKEAKQVRQSCRTISYNCTFDYSFTKTTRTPKIAIIREEGSNGDREMAAAFSMAGFETWDVTMTDLIRGSISLEEFRGVAFVGGFSYGDVLGSSKGWAACVLYNPKIREQFRAFRSRPNTFSLGVCNGCQLMAHLGWINEHESVTEASVFLDDNLCGRFESNFGPVRIEKSCSMMLSGMEGSILGLWSSHGEGRFTYRNPQILSQLRHQSQIAIRYTDDVGRSSRDPAEHLPYPWNPNGSEYDVAGICSPDGRHLAMMPHADRSFMTWQWADSMADWGGEGDLSPWIKMFRNAYDWSIRN